MALAKNIKGIPLKIQKDALKAALEGADWFVNTQVGQENQPTNSANFGRFLYNAHRYSDWGTYGIDWTSARALFVLLSAYQATKNKKYMDAIKNGMQYAYTLQIMDPRKKINYGAFHEETPYTDWIFPRDGTELADAFLQYYSITKDKEALYRAELFLDWFINNTVFKMKNGKTWIAREMDLENGKLDKRVVACEGGNTMVLAHAYKITKKAKYKKLLKEIMDSQIELYHKEPGPFRDKPAKKEGHHVTTEGIIDNDDGAGIGLLCAFDVLGNTKYLEHAISLADYHISKKANYHIYCALPANACFLLEMYRFTGDKKYLDASLLQLKGIFKMQHKEKKNLNAHGAFIGEDEGGINYVPGFQPKAEDMVTTRSTAFACLALFKAAGKNWPWGYSV